MKGFSLSDGPFIKGLDNALKTFNVHREQYYGGIFVGNHIHKTLQVNEISPCVGSDGGVGCQDIVRLTLHT